MIHSWRKWDLWYLNPHLFSTKNRPISTPTKWSCAVLFWLKWILELYYYKKQERFISVCLSSILHFASIIIYFLINWKKSAESWFFWFLWARLHRRPSPASKSKFYRVRSRKFPSKNLRKKVMKWEPFRVKEWASLLPGNCLNLMCTNCIKLAFRQTLPLK